MTMRGETGDAELGGIARQEDGCLDPKGMTPCWYDEELVKQITSDLVERGDLSCFCGMATENGQNCRRYLLATDLAQLIRRVLALGEQHERKVRSKLRNDGIAAAKKRGVRFGRDAKPLPQNFEIALTMWMKGEINVTTAARMCNMARSTFRTHAQKRLMKSGLES